MKKTVIFEAKHILKESDGKTWIMSGVLGYVVDTETKQCYYVRNNIREKCNTFTHKTYLNMEKKAVKIIKVINKEITCKQLSKISQEYINNEFLKINCNHDNEKIKSFYKNYWGCKENMQFEKILKVLSNFKELHQSPYSDSFYDSADIDWNHKPEGSLRLADHWNFWSMGQQHCVLENNENPIYEQWMLCQYRNGKYHIIESF